MVWILGESTVAHVLSQYCPSMISLLILEESGQMCVKNNSMSGSQGLDGVEGARQDILGLVCFGGNSSLHAKVEWRSLTCAVWALYPILPVCCNQDLIHGRRAS